MIAPANPFRIVRLLALLGLSATTQSCSGGAATAIDPLDTYCLINSAEIEERIDALLDTLTLGEKASLMHGVSIIPTEGTWQSTSLPDKGIPGFHMLDGPKGV
ncbi:MAG: hypothetical protein OER77_16160, partial [Myxococcales bacterium]|nr:hypothetical protein [Myxococcales bacterium]